jgi:hypothetical protein
MITWALRKRYEINTMRIQFIDEDDMRHELDQYEREALNRQKEVLKDSK